MATRGDFDHTAQFFSEKSKQWLPIAGIIDDLEATVTTEERLKDLKQMGFKKVKFLPGDETTDCPSCRAIAKKVHPIDNVPKVPPDDCTCVPWCRLCLVVHQ
jgi:hypothetical protein